MEEDREKAGGNPQSSQEQEHPSEERVVECLGDDQ